jgi:serine/threonine-protein kinase
LETTFLHSEGAERAPSSEERAVHKAPRVRELSPLDELPQALRERFDSVTLLGEGGMGTVYRARDRKLGREVAIKLIYGADVKTGWRFLQEVRAQARIEHPHVCKVFEVGAEGALRFIVMQLVHGEPLDKAKEAMTAEQKVKVIKEAAAALHEAHRAGFIHRDIKPSNIIVERGEDGSYKPYVMDFGLARELEAWGQTTTGAISGTPAYMAPEQARGEIRALDRRTDVFSLGATLYDLLAGRPPFAGGSLIELLRRVGRDEAQPIRKVNRAISEDLDTIVMKCLEREPNRRYDSARALADDLQRYLDGEPIRARRASTAYWLLKKLRKHRLAASISTILLGVAVVVVALWVRASRVAEEQAKLSQELGADLKEMELYMRYAHGLPLHDIEQERDIVRGRLRGIEERMARMGRAAEGPGNYAIGRGYLSLQEPEAALRHLRASAAAGYASPELELAMGRALGNLYKQALEEARRIGEPKKRKARISQIEADYRDPALSHLRAAAGSSLEPPAYVEGLIAFYGGRYDEARAKAREALVQSPWLHEAEMLAGDTHFAEGSPFKADAEFNYQAMMAHWKPAEEAYARAGTIARSDPLVHEAACELWIQAMFAEAERRAPAVESFERAKTACEMAVASSSRRSSAGAKLSRVYATYAHIMRKSPEAGPLADKAIVLAEAVAKENPNDAMAQYTLGWAWNSKSQAVMAAGANFMPEVENAITAYSRSLALDPHFLWATLELGNMYYFKAAGEHVTGGDAVPSIERALEMFDRTALLAPPGFVNHLKGECGMLALLMDVLMARGQSTSEAVERTRASCAELKGEHARLANDVIPYVYVNAARYAIATGADSSAALERATKALESALNADSKGEGSLENSMLLHSAEARYAAMEGGDPEPSLRKAREICKRLGPMAPIYRILCADVELIAVQWAMKTGKVRAADFSAASDWLLPILDKDPFLYLMPSQKMAEILERRAAFRLERGESPAGDIERGLAMAERALTRNPRHAEALVARGGLYLVRAKSARDPAAKTEAARLARASFTEAFQRNPLLEREHGPAAREAERLEGESRSQNTNATAKN